MSRSTTVGTPSVRIPPEGFGISTRRTGRGRHRPSTSACFTLGQCTLSQSLNSVTARSSTAGTPLFWTTRWYASHKLLRSTTRSIRWSSDFVRPDVAVPSSAPPRFVLGFRPARHASATLAGASASSLGFEIIRPTLGVVVRPFGVAAYLRASADFCMHLRGPLDPRSTAACTQISPGIAHPPSRLCASDLRHRVPYTYRALHLLAC